MYESRCRLGHSTNWRSLEPPASISFCPWTSRRKVSPFWPVAAGFVAGAARCPVDGGEVIPGGQSVWVVGAKDPVRIGGNLLQQRGRFTELARRLVDGGEVIPRGQRVRVVRAIRPFRDGQSALEESKCGGRVAEIEPH